MDYRRLLGRYEGKTFKSRRQFFPNSKRDDMQKYIVKTLGGGDIYKAIKPPSDDIHVNEWIAVNTIDFYNQLNLLYGCVSDVCTRESCPVMSAGARYEYLWPATKSAVTTPTGPHPGPLGSSHAAPGPNGAPTPAIAPAAGPNGSSASAASSSARPLKLAAPDYIEHMLNWVESQLDDPRVFPEGDAFPPDFIQRVRPIHKRMFRFYAHVYHSHLKALEQMGEDRHMNTCFKHFLIFVTTYDLVDAKELQALFSIVRQILEPLASQRDPMHGRGPGLAASAHPLHDSGVRHHGPNPSHPHGHYTTTSRGS